MVGKPRIGVCMKIHVSRSLRPCIIQAILGVGHINKASRVPSALIRAIAVRMLLMLLVHIKKSCFRLKVG